MLQDGCYPEALDGLVANDPISPNKQMVTHMIKKTYSSGIQPYRIGNVCCHGAGGLSAADGRLRTKKGA